MRNVNQCFRKICKSLNKGSVEAFEVAILRKTELTAALFEYNSNRTFGLRKYGPQYPGESIGPALEFRSRWDD
jgi:hypothetical protein